MEKFFLQHIFSNQKKSVGGGTMAPAEIFQKKMIKMKKLGILSLLFVLALSACRKDVDEVTTTVEPYEPPIINFDPVLQMVTGSVTGFVTDESGEPLTDAVVKLDGHTTTTDAFGHFFLTDISMNSRGQYVKVEKNGYFLGSRRFFPQAGEQSRVKIEMLAKNFDQTFDAQAGGTIESNGGANIVFPENSISKADGSAYTGTVKVATKWLDPSSLATLNQMPGNLQGVNRQNEEVVMATYGMMAVELESTSGEPLNITTGKSATLTMPVPASMQANAPAEIPLWSFHEDYGLWVEETTATLENGKYVGEVAHFSFWNCDAPYPIIELTITLIDEDGKPLSNFQVVVTNSDGNSGYGYSDENGNLVGLVPADQALTLEIYNICGDIVESQNIGPFPNDTNLGNILVDNPIVNSTIVTGKLIDCNGDALTNGLVIANYSGQSVYEYVTGGTFQLDLTTCPTTSDVEIIGVNLDDLLQSDPQTTGTNGQFYVGEISVCDQQWQNYIKITVDGETAVYTPAMIETNGTNYSWVEYGDQANGIYIGFSFFGTTAGDYSNENGIEVIGDNSRGWDLQGMFSSFEVTQMDGVGQPALGTFSGTLKNNENGVLVDVSVTGEFNIIQ